MVEDERVIRKGNGLGERACPVQSLFAREIPYRLFSFTSPPKISLGSFFFLFKILRLGKIVFYSCRGEKNFF